MKITKNGLKCTESTFFPLTPPLKEYGLYIQFNVDNYGLPLNKVRNHLFPDVRIPQVFPLCNILLALSMLSLNYD